MYTRQKAYRYYPIQRDPEVFKMIEKNNKSIYKIGFFMGLLGVGGYFLYKKVNELSKEMTKMKEEIRSE